MKTCLAPNLPEVGILDRGHQKALRHFIHVPSVTNSRTLITLTDILSYPCQVLIVEFSVTSIQPYVVGWSPNAIFVVTLAFRLGNEFI
jgi:hypothetical protein